MPKRWPLALLALTPLAQAVASTLCPADPWSCSAEGEQGWRCQGMPQTTQSAPVDPATRAKAETQLDAQRLEGQDGKQLSLIGGASVERADQRLSADRIDYAQDSGIASATGVVRYDDGATAFYAREANADLEQDATTLKDVRYALKARRGQGRASLVSTEGGAQTRLENVSYTTCPDSEASWEIRARSLDIDHAAGTATARGFQLRLGQVPIVYAPYASFPIDDRRKSGFLAPNIGFGSEGLDLTLPYYLNLAPNYDATLRPRWIGDRGGQLGGEFRYLSAAGQGLLDVEWLPDDDLYGSDRERYRFQHQGQLGAFSLLADVNKISDDRYFVDLGDSLNASSTSVLPSTLGVYTAGAGWNASLSADRYELVLPDVPESLQTEPYQRLPRAVFQGRWRQESWYAGVDTEWVRFAADENCLLESEGPCLRNERIEGRRFDLKPYAGFALEQSYGFVRGQAAWRYTQYDLDAPVNSLGSRDPDRSVPILSLDSGLRFERDQVFGNADWRQTLEPRLYYLRVPHREQSDLPVFDTAPYDFSFQQLFRDNRYAGADRQGDANQLTLAFTSRWFDDALGRERAALSLGQIRYFDEPRVFVPGEFGVGSDGLFLPPPERQRSAYVAEVRTRISDEWSLIGAYRYDPELERSDFGSARLQRRFGDNGVFNLGWRYRPGRIEQADVSVLWPLHERWRAVARWNYSYLDNTTLEALAGLEYLSCCYRVRLVGRNYLRGFSDERRTAVFIEVELTGLGSLGRDTGDFLRRAILGYSASGDF